MIMDKLALAATGPAQNLRLLVAHANLLHSLIDTRVAEAQWKEKEQHSWFIKSVMNATEPGCTLWANAIGRGVTDDSIIQGDYCPVDDGLKISCVGVGLEHGEATHISGKTWKRFDNLREPAPSLFKMHETPKHPSILSLAMRSRQPRTSWPIERKETFP